MRGNFEALEKQHLFIDNVYSQQLDKQTEPDEIARLNDQQPEDSYNIISNITVVDDYLSQSGH